MFGEGDNDNIGGEAGSDTFVGGDGNDLVFGDAPYIDASLHGDDYLNGGAGDDFLKGYGSDDVLQGDDTLDMGGDYMRRNSGVYKQRD